MRKRTSRTWRGFCERRGWSERRASWCVSKTKRTRYDCCERRALRVGIERAQDLTGSSHWSKHRCRSTRTGLVWERGQSRAGGRGYMCCMLRTMARQNSIGGPGGRSRLEAAEVDQTAAEDWGNGPGHKEGVLHLSRPVLTWSQPLLSSCMGPDERLSLDSIHTSHTQDSNPASTLPADTSDDKGGVCTGGTGEG